MHLIAGVFRIVGGFLLLALRLALPIAVIALAIFLIRRGSSGGAKRDTGGAAPRRDARPHFRGKVMTVSYREVKDDGKDEKSGGKDRETGGKGEGTA